MTPRTYWDRDHCLWEGSGDRVRVVWIPGVNPDWQWLADWWPIEEAREVFGLIGAA